MIARKIFIVPVILYFTGKFVGQCFLFGFLAFLTNYLYVLSLNFLTCTDVLSLFACNVAFVYLLSWVILHHQFVGIRVTQNPTTEIQ